MTRIHLPTSDPKLLLSGGGDGALILWDYLNGTKLHSVDLAEHLPVTASDSGEVVADVLAIASDANGFVATALEGVPGVLLLSIKGGNLVPLRVLSGPGADAKANPTAIEFTAPGRLLVAWESASTLVTLFDVATGEVVQDDSATTTLNTQCDLQVDRMPELFLYRQLRKFAKSTNRAAKAEEDEDNEEAAESNKRQC